MCTAWIPNEASSTASSTPRRQVPQYDFELSCSRVDVLHIQILLVICYEHRCLSVMRRDFKLKVISWHSLPKVEPLVFGGRDCKLNDERGRRCLVRFKPCTMRVCPMEASYVPAPRMIHHKGLVKDDCRSMHGIAAEAACTHVAYELPDTHMRAPPAIA